MLWDVHMHYRQVGRRVEIWNEVTLKAFLMLVQFCTHDIRQKAYFEVHMPSVSKYICIDMQDKRNSEKHLLGISFSTKYFAYISIIPNIVS